MYARPTHVLMMICACRNDQFSLTHVHQCMANVGRDIDLPASQLRLPHRASTTVIATLAYLLLPALSLQAQQHQDASPPPPSQAAAKQTNTPTTAKCHRMSQVEAEKAAWAVAKEHNLDLVTINPSYVLGPILNATEDALTSGIIKVGCLQQVAACAPGSLCGADWPFCYCGQPVPKLIMQACISMCIASGL